MSFNDLITFIAGQMLLVQLDRSNQIGPIVVCKFGSNVSLATTITMMMMTMMLLISDNLLQTAI